MTRTCVPVCARDLDGLHEACVRAKELGDIVELRLDCLDEAPGNISARPVILTYRPAEEGGHRDLSHEERIGFWKTAPRGESVWWDIEADLAHEISPDWSHVIISHHDFSGVASDLDQIYERLSQTPARVVKIAVQAKDVVDCLPVFQLIDRARNEGREIIAIAMGNAGLATRILGPSRGAFLT